MVLIGLMGSGKSILGKLLASRLSFELIDLDDLIVSQEQRSIPQIFEQRGEDVFRTLESKYLEKVIAIESETVISTGGGAVLAKKNRALMKSSGKVIWLDASPEILAARITGDSNRPLLHGVDPLEKMISLTTLRNPLYAEIADLQVDTGVLTDEEAVDKIVNFLSDCDA
ncbi:MAG: shikimate kinase [Ghiorsea sp.]